MMEGVTASHIPVRKNIPAHISGFKIAVLILIFMSAGQSETGNSHANPKHLAADLENALFFLQSGNAVKAQELFLKLYPEYLSRDSLYFFLSETMAARQSYDTALAFNLSIRQQNMTSPFYRSVISQRARIYSDLGLHEEALKWKKTNQPEYEDGYPTAAPELRFSLLSGYYRDDDIPQQELSFRRLDQADRTIVEAGPSYIGRIEGAWKYRIARFGTLSAGPGLKLSREYDNDYYDMDYGLVLNWDQFFQKRLAFGYRFMNNLKSNRIRVLENSFEFSYRHLTDANVFNTLFWYSMERGSGLYTDSDFLMSALYWESGKVKGRSFGAGTDFQVLRFPAFVLPEPVNVLHAGDVSLTDPVFYTDSRYSIPVELPGGRVPSGLMDSLRNHLVITDLPTVLPQNFFSFGANVSFTKSVLIWLDAGSAVSVSTKIFPETYVWYSETGSWDGGVATSGMPWIVKNAADGEYYGVYDRDASESSSLGQSILQEPLTVRQNRIDGSLLFKIFGRMPENRLGYVSVESYVERTWSSLSSSAPLEIPKWEFGGSVSLKRTFFR